MAISLMRGVAFGPSTGFHMPDGALLAPDASWVRRDRWEALTATQRQEYAPLCPDAVFEVASPSDSLPNLREKMRSYLANGAGLAVLVDPRRRAVEIFKPDRAPEVVESARLVSCGPVLPGLTLELESILS